MPHETRAPAAGRGAPGADAPATSTTLRISHGPAGQYDAAPGIPLIAKRAGRDGDGAAGSSGESARPGSQSPAGTATATAGAAAAVAGASATGAAAPLSAAAFGFGGARERRGGAASSNTSGTASTAAVTAGALAVVSTGTGLAHGHAPAPVQAQEQCQGRPAHIHRLPDVLLLRCLLCLAPESLAQCQAVCGRWREVCGEDEVWKRLCKDNLARTHPDPYRTQHDPYRGQAEGYVTGAAGGHRGRAAIGADPTSRRPGVAQTPATATASNGGSYARTRRGSLGERLSGPGTASLGVGSSCGSGSSEGQVWPNVLATPAAAAAAVTPVAPAPWSQLAHGTGPAAVSTGVPPSVQPAAATAPGQPPPPAMAAAAEQAPPPPAEPSASPEDRALQEALLRDAQARHGAATVPLAVPVALAALAAQGPGRHGHDHGHHRHHGHTTVLVGDRAVTIDVSREDGKDGGSDDGDDGEGKHAAGGGRAGDTASSPSPVEGSPSAAAASSDGQAQDQDLSHQAALLPELEQLRQRLAAEEQHRRQRALLEAAGGGDAHGHGHGDNAGHVHDHSHSHAHCSGTAGAGHDDGNASNAGSSDVDDEDDDDHHGSHRDREPDQRTRILALAREAVEASLRARAAAIRTSVIAGFRRLVEGGAGGPMDMRPGAGAGAGAGVAGVSAASAKVPRHLPWRLAWRALPCLRTEGVYALRQEYIRKGVRDLFHPNASPDGVLRVVYHRLFMFRRDGTCVYALMPGEVPEAIREFRRLLRVPLLAHAHPALADLPRLHQGHAAGQGQGLVVQSQAQAADATAAIDAAEVAPTVAGTAAAGVLPSSQEPAVDIVAGALAILRWEDLQAQAAAAALGHSSHGEEDWFLDDELGPSSGLGSQSLHGPYQAPKIAGSKGKGKGKGKAATGLSSVSQAALAPLLALLGGRTGGSGGGGMGPTGGPTGPSSSSAAGSSDSGLGGHSSLGVGLWRQEGQVVSVAVRSLGSAPAIAGRWKLCLSSSEAAPAHGTWGMAAEGARLAGEDVVPIGQAAYQQAYGLAAGQVAGQYGQQGQAQARAKGPGGGTAGAAGAAAHQPQHQTQPQQQQQQQQQQQHYDPEGWLWSGHTSGLTHWSAQVAHQAAQTNPLLRGSHLPGLPGRPRQCQNDLLVVRSLMLLDRPSDLWKPVTATVRLQRQDDDDEEEGGDGDGSPRLGLGLASGATAARGTGAGQLKSNATSSSTTVLTVPVSQLGPLPGSCPALPFDTTGVFGTALALPAGTALPASHGAAAAVGPAGAGGPHGAAAVQPTSASASWAGHGQHHGRWSATAQPSDGRRPYQAPCTHVPGLPGQVFTWRPLVV